MISRKFITAGRAVFTVDNGKGQWYTFRVKKKDAANGYPTTYFVSLLTGPDNTNDFTYVGIMEGSTGRLILTRKSKFTQDTTAVKVFSWATSVVWSDGKFPSGYSVRHEGRCCRCGRALTVPESLETGFGPECLKLVGI